MKKTLTAAAIAGALILTPTLAHAAEDPFIITDDGVQLTSGTFQDNQHVNIRTTTGQTHNAHFEAKCITRTDAECKGTRHLVAQSIGTNLLPWEALGIPAGNRCAIWGQYSGTNFHFGEASGKGQIAGPDCAAPSDPEDPKTTPTDPPVTEEPTPEPTEEPTPEPTETPVDPEPTPTPTVPLEPAGSDMRPLLGLGAGGLIAAGIAALIVAARRKARG